MKKCKDCQKEIDPKATKCPHCQTDQRNWFMKHKITTFVLVLILLSIIGNSSKTENKSAEPNKQIETEKAVTTEKKTEVKPTEVSKSVVQEPTAKPVEKKSSGVTMAKFTSITEGMSYSEVASILGGPGEVMSSSDVAGYKTVMYQWKGESIMGNMNAMFQNDKMVSKAQFGLK